ncbi:CU044_2847 family protein [Streptomyces sp. NBC_01410]|uniref:CU044_2847 family protein n=1 Tax=Streptomyces sp. NBC_01410 TaxID=2903856 RepID=UPI003864D622
MRDRSDFVPVVLRDGSVLQVEVETGEELVASRVFDFSDLTQRISSVASELGEVLRTVGPDAATVELGFEVGIEPGGLTAMLVKGTGKANLKLTLEWRNDKPATHEDPPSLPTPSPTSLSPDPGERN